MNNEQLVIQIKACGADTADHMLQLYQNLKGLIHSVAWRYKGYGELEDLEQEGYLALYSAVDGYDPDAGASFATYAFQWIRQAVSRYIQMNSSSLRLPVHSQERIVKYKRLVDSFQKEANRKPTDAEICHYLGISLEQCQRLGKDRYLVNMESLDGYVSGTDGEKDITIGETVASEEDVEESVLNCIQEEQLRQDLWSLVDSLGERQSDVIRKRFQDNMTLEAIGNEYGISRDAIRQVESKALRELRKPRNSKRLQPYIDEIRSAAMSGVGVSRFNETWTSATERVAIGQLEREEMFQRHREQLEAYRKANIC